MELNKKRILFAILLCGIVVVVLFWFRFPFHGEM